MFSNVDFGDWNAEYVDQLINNYLPIFDFNFINSSLLKALIDANKKIKILREENKSLKYEFSPMTRIAKSREDYDLFKKFLGNLTFNGWFSIMQNIRVNDSEKKLVFSDLIAQFMKKGIDFVNKMNLPSILSQEEYNYYTALSNYIQNNISILENKESTFKNKISLFLKQADNNSYRIYPNKCLKPLSIIIEKILNNEEFCLIALENKENFNELNSLLEDFKVIVPKFHDSMEKMKARRTSK